MHGEERILPRTPKARAHSAEAATIFYFERVSNLLLFFQVCFFEEDMESLVGFWSIYSFKSLK